MLTKEQFEGFRLRADALLKELGDEYEVDIHCGKITYGDDDFSISVRATRKMVGNKPYEQAEFEKYCESYGFEPEDYGKRFNKNGKDFMLIGFSPKAKKMPVLAAEIHEGKLYKLSPEAAKNAMTPRKEVDILDMDV